MTPEIVTRLPAADLERLAVLHRTSLPRSILSVMGQAAVVRYYRQVIASPTELVAIARNDLGMIDAGVVVSRTPGTLLRRFAAAAPVALATELGRNLLLSSDLRRRFVRRLRESEPHGTEGLPELVQIFTDASLRGRGIGADLVSSCEDALRRGGVPAYVIRTHRDGNEAGIRFYTRLGFTILGETRSFGDYYVVMKKELR